MKLGDLILEIVKQLGAKHMFGVPGDYNLRFLDYIVEEPEIAWIGNCNELNAAYAAQCRQRDRRCLCPQCACHAYCRLSKQ